MSVTVTKLQTRKNAPGETRLVREQHKPLAQGEVLFAVDRFALTANNITYAAFGDAMSYWQFFPTGDPAWGHMPVWGFADVVASDIEGISQGERFYGYFPAASHIAMTPIRISERGFYDGAPHREKLVSAYNQYTRCSADPAWTPDAENHQMLLRPLFITSFMLADYLADNRFFGAEQVVFSSASSKTAYGTAWCIGEGPAAVALTSGPNRSFTEELGIYRRSLSYDDFERIDAGGPTLYVDFSGDTALRARIHRHFAGSLVHDCFAGSAQNYDFIAMADLPGPQPRFFFAPDQIKKRNADWGGTELSGRIKAAQARFVAYLTERRLLEIDVAAGLTAAQSVVAIFAAGRTDPRRGHVIRLDERL
ncbi:hypothetical protein MesoLjLc_10170 [Mesorhizobium sp. L-8-10]|uniref:DUF2855 family protein n=1 Tax=unclassified Mesorhizobium TaxID=325217 RepID=UPI001925B5E6|nr:MULTISPECIES: DUF2855 family protein [unclassified Mesorhizobium]BCH21245.1 hypothetical protein MesoLjLb_10300 [Mesorhizobium sp. L-8-3]BCH29087.1 hypothetical protein MesoLjLc_10170 [Mesorhizobium sp. L-8-10]